MQEVLNNSKTEIVGMKVSQEVKKLDFPNMIKSGDMLVFAEPINVCTYF